MTHPVGYFRATRHPYPCLLFLLPLLAGYEAGVAWLGGTDPESLRNGADNWLRWGLAAVGLHNPWLPPVAVLLIFILWSWTRQDDRPTDTLGVLSGMGIESVVCALGLWALSRSVAPVLRTLGVSLAVGPGVEPALRQVIPYVGAGIYEEALFRLLLYSFLRGLLRRIELLPGLAAVLAALASAALFSAAHHVGPYGQPYSNYLFLFRLVAGLYFTALFQLRGFGIVVGAHACYNVLVSAATG
jgi:hypothetical protein